jgi:hypothetical protein
MIEANTSIDNSQQTKRITTRTWLSQEVRRNYRFLRLYRVAVTATIANTLALRIGSCFHHRASATLLYCNFNHPVLAHPLFLSNLTIFLKKAVTSSCHTGQFNGTSIDMTIGLIVLIPLIIVLILGLLTALNLFTIFNSIYP